MNEEERKKIKFQNDTLRELCQNRKRQNFEELKKWDHRRAQYLTAHRKVADQIQQALQNRLAQSNQFINVVVQFLIDLDNQQKKYQSQNVSNPQIKLNNNTISKNIYITSSKCLQRIHNQTQNFKGFRKVKAILDQGIKTIDAILSESQRQIMDIRTKIELQAVQIQNTNAETKQKCDKVVENYRQDKPSKIFQSENDLFYLQHEFILQAIHQTEIQCNFGYFIVELFDSIQKHERQKLTTVKQVLQKYLQAVSTAREDNETVKALLDILEKQTEQQYIDILYSSEELISKQVLKEVKKVENKLQSQTIDIKEIRKFLTGLRCPSFDGRNLVLKEYRLYFKIDDQLWNCLTIITVDGFMHVYESKQQEQHSEADEQLSPDYSVALSNIEMCREGDIRLNMTVKKWQLLKFRKEQVNTINFVFMNEDQREQFIEFIGKMTPI